MSFSGKKFRRIRSENIEELVALTSAKSNPHIVGVLNCDSPIFSFTRQDADTFVLDVQHEGQHKSLTFKLGEEIDIQKTNAVNMKITFTLEGDHVLQQVIKFPDGKTTFFKREFGEKEAKMTIKILGIPEEARIFYELVNDS